MLFDDPDSYYQPDDGRYWQQGDIVLAPSAVFDADHTHLDDVPVEPPKPGAPIRRLVWPDTTSEDTRAVVCEAELSPAIITTHDCTLDKEFNRRVSQLRLAHVPLEEATRQAAQDGSLDRYLTVAPIVPFDDAAPSDPHQLARNTVVGYFPVCRSTDRHIDAGVADILRATTIDKTLIVDRFAILGDAAVAALRYALARFWVYRSPKLTFDLEQAIGQTIIDARISQDELLALELELKNGQVLRLLQAPPEAGAGTERPGVGT